MNLEKLNLVELSVSEAKNIEGGNWFGRAWRWLKDHLEGFIEGGVDGSGPYGKGGVRVNF